MKLYITPGSPYARMARIVVLEKGLRSRVETVIAKTRAADSPYYGINPSGRVPYLVRDDGVGMEESALICAYLDHLDGKPAFDPPGNGQSWEARRLEALARSLLDGLSVWLREILRRANERSPGLIQHEHRRQAVVHGDRAAERDCSERCAVRPHTLPTPTKLISTAPTGAKARDDANRTEVRLQPFARRYLRLLCGPSGGPDPRRRPLPGWRRATERFRLDL